MKDFRNLGFRPNSFPGSLRLWNTVVAAFLLVYGAIGVYMDDLYVRGKRGRGFHLHGPPAWIMYGAFVCGALTLLSLVIDHYDQRNNERHYRAFAQWMRIVGWLMFFAAILTDLFVYHRATR